MKLRLLNDLLGKVSIVLVEFNLENSSWCLQLCPAETQPTIYVQMFYEVLHD